MKQMDETAKLNAKNKDVIYTKRLTSVSINLFKYSIWL